MSDFQIIKIFRSQKKIIIPKKRNSTSAESFINPLTPELNPSAQGCLTRFFTGEFTSWTVHFVNICLKNQQIHQLVIKLIMYGSSYMFRHYIAILREHS
jgi:hypothetical protein